jgi:hypothetical protein|tara:strand:- start:222 stop:389 length:168 start_codon:yes stop_codon:yes gene_type:complete
MSINKRYVPELHKLKKILIEQGSDSFARTYIKPDILIGPSDSLEFIDLFAKEYLD